MHRPVGWRLIVLILAAPTGGGEVTAAEIMTPLERVVTIQTHVMSASGTKRTSISKLSMSAFGGKADIPDRLTDVR